MKQDEVTLEEVRGIAADIGMTGLSQEHLQQFLRAAKAARARRAALKTETLGPADEPAHVFRPAEDAK
jgi:hypothetical protein